MNLKALKLESIDKHSQVIIFNDHGTIIESDNTMVKIDAKKNNVFVDSMFYGMNESFAELSVGEEMKFDCIHTDLFGYESHYDFIIKRLSDNEERRYGWIIFDYANQYEKIFELQQERNQAEIHAKKIEHESKKLKEQKDAIEKLYKDLQADTDSQYILIKSENLLINLCFRDIYYFEAYGDYIKVYSKEKVYITLNTMKKIEEILPENQFYRIHRSFIVRLDKVQSIEQLSVQVNEKVLPMGKSFKAPLIKRIGQL